jgi:hypothetical protein
MDPSHGRNTYSQPEHWHVYESGRQMRNTTMRTAAEDNVPPRFELFILGDGEKKVVETADTRT